MSFYRYLRRHLIVVISLILIGYGIAAYIYIACPQKIGQPHARGVKFDFAPVLNEDGNTVHALLDIGYNRGLLIVESVIALLIIWLIYRIVLYYNFFFAVSNRWCYFLDLGCAASIARLPLHLSGVYVLDYLYIRAGHGTYDFFDFCLGICFAGIVVWCIPICIKYHKYKKANTKGMNFWGKFKWEMKFAFEIIKRSLHPVKTWWDDAS